MRRIVVALAVLFLSSPPAPARADEVELQGGTRVAGDVLERGDAGVRLLLPAGDEVTLAPGDVKRVTVLEGAPGGGTFLRFVEDGPRPGLEAGVAHYVKAGAPRVDLVGAVHAADAAYFRAVQALLDRADLVLYEMVKKEGADPWAKPTDAERAQSPVSKFQATLAKAFELAFQLDEIDYRRRHFVHADMTAEEFLAKGGGALTKEMAAMIAKVGPLLEMAARMLNPSPDAAPATQASARAMRTTVKRTLGAMLASAGTKGGGLLGGLGGDDLILGRRNDVAMGVFDAQPTNVRSIAIFYGAAHMPDLEQRLLARGYARAGGHWVTAWDVSPAKDAPAAPAAPSKPAPATPAPVVPAMDAEPAAK